MLLSLILTAISFFATYPSDCSDAMEFMKANRDSANIIMATLTPRERVMALAIVAPEVSQYSHVIDFVELRSLFVLYVHQGRGNFSVGRFQMKPSFVEMLERELKKHPDLNAKYGKWITDVASITDLTEKRRTRLHHLDDINWQLKYLTIFFELAKKQTAAITFASDDEMLRHFATLYNSGLLIDQTKVRQMQARRLFPHGVRRFNYADVASEFFKEFTSKSPI